MKGRQFEDVNGCFWNRYSDEIKVFPSYLTLHSSGYINSIFSEVFRASDPSQPGNSKIYPLLIDFHSF